MQHEKNSDRTRRTRAALIASARELFVRDGYSETSTPAVVEKAGVTRGALYHHFADKLALFSSVVEREAELVADLIKQGAGDEVSAVDAIVKGGDAYLAAMAEPGRTQLLLIEGPAVLGYEKMRSLNQAYGDRELAEGLEMAQSQGVLAPIQVTVLSTLLSSLYDAAALAIAQGASSDEYKSAIEHIVGGLIRR